MDPKTATSDLEVAEKLLLGLAENKLKGCQGSGVDIGTMDTAVFQITGDAVFR